MKKGAVFIVKFSKRDRIIVVTGKNKHANSTWNFDFFQNERVNSTSIYRWTGCVACLFFTLSIVHF